ncbi:hypothetical protein RA086_02305 [Lactiplantibacillus sp. WILCCON 0030]|uniref:FtsK domain-containing protein n=1 Tax=Lactiplantibacillus brownii TaxID=3069269 RepID=A0ABU1A693_9LACO|nr:hypothetical protein [Lactiplantibacillus brownii]MDQ7936477.1 hypothetical protein [Lactiplantibacillus brownii]
MMKQSEFGEFIHFLLLRLKEWLTAKIGDDRAKELNHQFKTLGHLLARTYFENIYLNAKNRLIQKVKQQYRWEIITHSRLKVTLLVVALLLLTWLMRWLVVLDIGLLLGFLAFRHYQYEHDISHEMVELIMDDLPQTSLSRRNYNYPLKALKELVGLYKDLYIDRQRISIDDFIFADTLESQQIPNYGKIVQIQLSGHSPVLSARNMKDYWLIKYRLLPEPKLGLYINKGYVNIDLISVLADESPEKLASRMVSSGFFNQYIEVRNMVAKDAQTKELNERQEYIIERGLPTKLNNIWHYFDIHSTEIGFTYWDNNGKSVDGNDNYLRLRMRLVGDTTFDDAKKKSGLVAKELRCNVMVKGIASDPGSFWMTFLLKNIEAPKTATIAQIKEDAKTGKVRLGNSRTGSYLMNLPRGDSLTSLLLGGLSRSGKSTLATQVITALLYLKTGGTYDYSDVYVATVKPEDYQSNGFEASGMVVKGNPSDIYDMLSYVDEKATARRDLFTKNGCKNISEYNSKFPTKRLGKWLVVFDEYANTMAAAESEKVEIAGKKVKLSIAIENLVVKITQEHASRGVSFICITQQFAKNAIGRVFDNFNAQVLGYARSNVWNSVDSTQEMSKYIDARDDERRGMFFINAPDYPVDIPQVTFNSGFTEVKTANIITDEVRADFDRKFDTAKKYGGNDSPTSIDAPALEALFKI